ncbi:MAG TPA: hypothetical protein GXX23_00240 [Firmicutes bacterium]|nr:hypothetical protein [Candidatus Fermentithermobacillaceae bacterium]
MLTIIIMGSREIRHMPGWCGSRTQEEVILNYTQGLRRRFGAENLYCRYIDISDPEAGRFKRIVHAVRRQEIGLPLAIRDGEVILHGKDTLFKLPDYIEGVLRPERKSILNRLFSDKAGRRLRAQLRGLKLIDISSLRSRTIGRVTLGGRTSIFKGP